MQQVALITALLLAGLLAVGVALIYLRLPVGQYLVQYRLGSGCPRF